MENFFTVGATICNSRKILFHIYSCLDLCFFTNSEDITEQRTVTERIWSQSQNSPYPECLVKKNQASTRVDPEWGPVHVLEFRVYWVRQLRVSLTQDTECAKLSMYTDAYLRISCPFSVNFGISSVSIESNQMLLQKSFRPTSCPKFQLRRSLVFHDLCSL
jgi:hypothetical protein